MSPAGEAAIHRMSLSCGSAMLSTASVKWPLVTSLQLPPPAIAYLSDDRPRCATVGRAFPSSENSDSLVVQVTARIGGLEGTTAMRTSCLPLRIQEIHKPPCVGRARARGRGRGFSRLDWHVLEFFDAGMIGGGRRCSAAFLHCRSLARQHS